MEPAGAAEADAERAEGLAVQSDPLVDDDAEEPLSEEIGTVLVLTDDDALTDATGVRWVEALGEAPCTRCRPRPTGRSECSVSASWARRC